MNNCKFPVIAIPQDCRYIPINKILFLTDYSLSQLHNLRKVHNLALLFGAEIDVLQVSTVDSGQDKIFGREWRKFRAKSDVHFYFLTSNDIEGTITDFIELQKSNLVVITTHHYNFFKSLFQYSLSKNLAFHSKIPVLSISAERD
ncbi:MAG: universal stress protein [Flavobacterium sp. JAD_PAG50586_2]|nr:MAG: universal stress protein [Flavobacterium sp. JAD_PAG50586_2]